jgi:hypothetical protein
MAWTKMSDRKPKSHYDVLIKGTSPTFGTVRLIGYYHKREKRFVTSAKGWNVDFKLWQPLPR